MKKVLLLIFCLLTITSNYSQKRDVSHWSMTLEGGASMLDADVMQTYNNVIPTSLGRASLGGSIEYTITPIWSMGVEYYYLPFFAEKNPNNPAEHTYTVDGKMHNVNYFMAFNFIKGFLKEANSKWGVWPTIGGGMAFYDTKYRTNGKGRVNNNDYPDRGDTVRNGRALTVPVGVIAEYNFTKNLAIGTKIQYRSYNKDNVDGRNFRGVTNDFLSLITLQLRWKFNAQNADHTRNISSVIFNQEPTGNFNPEYSYNKLNGKLDSLQNELNKTKPLIDDLKKKLDDEKLDTDGDGVPNYKDKEPDTPRGNRVDAAGVTISNTPVIINPAQPQTPVVINTVPDDVSNRLALLEKIIKDSGIDTDGDGVPDNRDQEPNTPDNTPVDFWGRKITGYALDGSAVFFDFDKTDLDAAALKAINLAAAKLKSDPTLLVEVRGFADYMGNTDYNQKLSQRRADKVKNELVTKYGINPNRIIANGKGRVLEPRMATRMNRRCNFFYDK